MSRQVNPAISWSHEKLRAEFPILQRKLDGQPLVYFDNAATLQKPQSVIRAESSFYEKHNANVHRSAHRLSFEATSLFEAARKEIASYIGTEDPHELIFTKGATEAINLIAQSWARPNLREGDELIVSRAEHHANFVPWQQLAKEKGLNLRIVELDSDFQINVEAVKALLSERTKLVALTGLSNVTGERTPLNQIVSVVRERSPARVLVDACQALLYIPNVLQEWTDVDFIVASSHKMGGPTGVGCLWAKKDILESMPPYQYGGEMISVVYDQDSRWNGVPFKFEAGTPPIAQAIGWAESVRFWQSQDRDHLNRHLHQLCERAIESFSRFPEVKLLGRACAEGRHPTFSFAIEGLHPHDLGSYMDQYAVAIRGGHHCAQPLHRQLGFGASSRASLSYYNRLDEWDTFDLALGKALEFFRIRKK